MPFHDDCIRFPRGGAQEKRRRKRRPLCEQRDLVSVMNNTRWRKLRAAMLALAPSSPSYRIQNVENGVGGRALARCRSRGAKSDGPAVGSSADGSSTTLSTGVGSDVSSGASGRSVRHNSGGTIDCGDFAREQGVGTMPETARPTRINAERVPRQSRLPAFVVLLAFVVGLAANLEVSSCSMLVMGPVASTAHAQPAGSSRLQLRAKIKSAAEKLNDIASAGPDMTRAMFAGKTSSTIVLALNEKSIAAQGELESAVLAAEQGGALSADESKELARLGELAKRLGSQLRKISRR